MLLCMMTITLPFVGSQEHASEAKQFLLHKLRERYRIHGIFQTLEHMNSSLRDQDIEALLDENVLEQMRKKTWEERLGV